MWVTVLSNQISWVQVNINYLESTHPISKRELDFKFISNSDLESLDFTNCIAPSVSTDGYHQILLGALV